MLYIHNRAMNSEKNKDLFLKQVEQILDGIRKDKEKVSGEIFSIVMYSSNCNSSNAVAKMRKCKEIQLMIYTLNL